MLRDGDLRIDLDGEINASLPHPSYLFQREAYRHLLQLITAAHERLERLNNVQGQGKLDFESCQAYRTIFVCAPRGAGKSTFVRHLEWGLKQALGEKARGKAGQPPAQGQDIIDRFGFLPPIDPTSIIYPKADTHSRRENPYAFLRLLIGYVLKWYDRQRAKNAPEPQYGWKDSRAPHHSNTVKKNGEDLNRLIAIASGDHEDYGLDGIGASQAAMRLPSEIHSFFGEICKAIQIDALILPLDDVDMAAEDGFSVLEALRNFLTTPFLQPVVTGDIDLYTLIIKENFRPLFEKADSLDGNGNSLLDRVVSAFITKIFPPNFRVTLRSPFDLLDENPIFFISNPKSGNVDTGQAAFDSEAVEFRLFIEVLIKIIFWKVPKYWYRDELEKFLRDRSLRGLIQGPLIFAPHVRQLGRILEILKKIEDGKASSTSSQGAKLEPTKDLANMYASLRAQRNEIFRDYSGHPVLIEYLSLYLMYNDTNNGLGHSTLLRRFSHLIESMSSVHEYRFAKYVGTDIKASLLASKHPLISEIFNEISGNKNYQGLSQSQNTIILSKHEDGSNIHLPGPEASLILKLISGDLSAHHREFGLRRPTIAVGNLIKLIFSSFDLYSEGLDYSQNTRSSCLRGFSRILDCFNAHERYVGNLASSEPQIGLTEKGNKEALDWRAIYQQASTLLVGDEKDRSKWPEAFLNTKLGNEVLEWPGEHAFSHKLPIFITSCQMERLVQYFYKITFSDPKQLSGITLATYLYRAVDQLKAAIIETSEPTGDAYLYQPARIAGMVDDHPIVKMMKSAGVQKDLEQIKIGRAKDDITLIFELFDSEHVSRVSGRIAGPNKKDLARRVALNIDTLARRAITFSRQDREILKARLGDRDTSAYQTLRLAWPLLDPDSRHVMGKALDVELETLNATYGRKPSGVKPS